VDGFYYADFTHSCNPSTFDEGIKDEGTHHWKIRFTPFEAGPWKVIISCVDADGTTTYPEELSFNCIPVAHAKGFIRKANNMYLKYDNGDFYFPVNMNAGWCDATNTTICSYRDWIDEFSENGGTNLRFLANSYWNISLEKHENDNHYTPGDYTVYMKQAYRLDNIIEYAGQKGVNIAFVMDNHVLYNCRGYAKCYFRTENPYYSGNLNHAVYPYGASSLYDCFRTTPRQPYLTLMKWQKQRTRYMIARWGYAANISDWEIMGEIDLLDSLKNNPENISIIMDYVKYMVSFIKKTDIYGHLVTISGLGDIMYENLTPNSHEDIQFQLYSLSGIDYVCHHKYGDNYIGNVNNFKPERLPAFIGELIPQSLRVFKKPVVLDETLWPGRNHYPEGDPKGYLCHNLLWTSVFSGAMGTASMWDWVPILLRNPAPFNKYYCPGYMLQYKAIAEYMKSMNLLDQQYTPFQSGGDYDPYRCHYLAGNTKIYGYIQNKEYDWENLYDQHKSLLFDSKAPDKPSRDYYPAGISPHTSCTIQVNTPGTYRVSFYSTGLGHPLMETATFVSKSKHKENIIELQLPGFDWDCTFVAELQQ
ncbi:MAG: hypothetical protein Q8867_10845, partial [Bacteroidota bacterium]|nr:hypothetical protein [Bacteroidota bacterium]